jgi:hypothetical protein
MKLLFTKSKLPTGPLITWGLEEPVSHFEVLFFGTLILQSNFFGVHISKSSDSKKYTHVVFEKEIKLDFQKEALLFVTIIMNYFGKKYDWAFFFSLVMSAIKKKLFRMPISPESIKWRSRDRFLCTEVVVFLKDVLGNIEVGNGSPYQLWLKVKDIQL